MRDQVRMPKAMLTVKYENINVNTLKGRHRESGKWRKKLKMLELHLELRRGLPGEVQVRLHVVVEVVVVVVSNSSSSSISSIAVVVLVVVFIVEVMRVLVA